MGDMPLSGRAIKQLTASDGRAALIAALATLDPDAPLTARDLTAALKKPRPRIDENRRTTE